MKRKELLFDASAEDIQKGLVAARELQAATQYLITMAATVDQSSVSSSYRVGFATALNRAREASRRAEVAGILPDPIPYGGLSHRSE